MNFDLELKIDKSEFLEWTESATAGIKGMAETLREMVAIFEVHSRRYTPLEKGYLEQMQESEVIQDYPFFEVEMRWSGEFNPKSQGYDYAYYQMTENVYHPLRPKGQNVSNFVEKGRVHSFGSRIARLESDYVSALRSGSL